MRSRPLDSRDSENTYSETWRLRRRSNRVRSRPMGEIVAAIGTAHSPYSFTRPPDEKADEIDLSIECMKELGRILDETKPDVIIFIGNDHLETFSMTCMPTFAIIAGNTAHAEWAGRECNLTVHREMAEAFLERLIDRGFDLAY